MAKRTLESIKKCPIDFLYLWASDSFISKLGSKANIIRSKKYNQYQTLWKTVVENNPKASSQAELQEVYNQWISEISAEIKNVYGISPSAILEKLAMGEDVLGKNWSKGVYGIGDVSNTFVQNSSVTVDRETGKILVDGVEAPGQTAIYSANGDTAVVTGYSYYDSTNNVQFQSGVSAIGQFGAVCYTDSTSVQRASGGNFDPTTGSFWQNANNYMPIVNDLLNWLMSLVESYTGQNRVVLTSSNTVPKQTEWIEEDNTGLWIAGGLALAGAAVLAFGKKNNNQ